MTDLLREASQALREFGTSGNDSSSLTRARVLSSLQRTKRISMRRPLVAIPLAALLIGSLAIAATGHYLPLPVQKWLTGLIAQPSSNPMAHERHLPSGRAAQLPPTIADSGVAPTPTADALQPDEPLPTQQHEYERATSVAKFREVPAHLREGSSQSEATEEKPISEEEYERYRLAHEAHFVKKDPAAALAAWSEYLAHAPSGRLAVEARYNRALCLLKLGRNQEAIAALRPFTRGSYGAYRQKEAQRVIAQLDGDAGVQPSSLQGRD